LNPEPRQQVHSPGRLLRMDSCWARGFVEPTPASMLPLYCGWAGSDKSGTILRAVGVRLRGWHRMSFSRSRACSRPLRPVIGQHLLGGVPALETGRRRRRIGGRSPSIGRRAWAQMRAPPPVRKQATHTGYGIGGRSGIGGSRRRHRSFRTAPPPVPDCDRLPGESPCPTSSCNKA
jgi:hypothetical protein